MNALGERAKLILLCFLLLFMLWVLALTAVNTYQAVRNFQQQNSALASGDVSTIDSWMTIRVISHIYHVPEDYLQRTLQIGSSDLLRHATLNQIASRKRQPVKQLIRNIQYAILNYRKEHAHLTPTPKPGLSPTPTQRTGMKPRFSKPGVKLTLRAGMKPHSFMTGRT